MMEYSKKEIEELIEERNRLSYENQILYKKIEDLEDEKCSDLRKYISLLEKRLKGLEKNSKKESNENNCSELEKTVKELRDELEVLYENEKKYEDLFERQKASIEEWKNKYRSLETEFKKEIKEKEKENKNLRTEADKCKTELKSLRKELRALSKELETVKEENTSLKEEKNEYEKKYKNLKISFDMLMKEYDNNLKSIRKLKEELGEYQGWKIKYLAMVNKQNLSEKENRGNKTEKEENKKISTETLIELLELMFNREYDTVVKIMLGEVKKELKNKK